MKNTYLLLFTFSSLFLFSCHDNTLPDIDYDCSVKSTVFESNETESSWNIVYYKNQRIVRYETSNLYWYTQKYDSNWNLIERNFEDGKATFEYNFLNLLIKTQDFHQGQLQHTALYTYTDTLQTSYIRISANGDTVSSYYSYYDIEGRVDSVVFPGIVSYYYYTPELDSIYSVDDNQNHLFSEYLKYDRTKLSYRERRNYHLDGSEETHFIYTWEYNEDLLLTRNTEGFWNSDDLFQWKDIRYSYNENNDVLELSYYDENNTRLGYSNYIYENNVLVKIESFNSIDELTYTTIVEDSCNF